MYPNNPTNPGYGPPMPPQGPFPPPPSSYGPNNPYNAYPNQFPPTMPFRKMSSRGHPQFYDPPEVERQFNFTEKSVRQAFVAKVYALLSIQMIATIFIVMVFIFVDPVKSFVLKHRFLYIIALVFVLVLIIVLGCFTKPRRTFPLNYILLGVFTLAEGFLVGVISVQKDTSYVLYAGVITLAIVISITLFALQTSLDFTYLTGFMLIVSVIFFAFAILAFMIRDQTLQLIYCCVGVLIFSMFLLIDTQLMLGGTHHYSISPEDYVFCALNLYVDIVQIFMMTLGIFSNSE